MEKQKPLGHSHAIDIPGPAASVEAAAAEAAAAAAWADNVVKKFLCTAVITGFFILAVWFPVSIVYNTAEDRNYYRDPKYQIQMNCSTSPATSSSSLITKCDIDLYATNPNRKIEQTYTNFKLFLSGKGEDGRKFIEGTSIQLFSQRPKETALLHTSISHLGGIRRNTTPKLRVETEWDCLLPSNFKYKEGIRCIDKVRVLKKHLVGGGREEATTINTTLQSMKNCDVTYYEFTPLAPDFT